MPTLATENGVGGPSGRVTISQIAERAGVSIGAVSYALNGKPGVSETTRERVSRIAQELGWNPSHAARSLSTSRANAIGLVLARPPRLLGIEPFYMEFISGAEETFAQHGISLMLHMVPTIEKEIATYREWAAQRRVDGVLLVDLAEGDPRPRAVLDIGIPAITVSSTETANGLPHVWTDDYGAMRDAMRYLVRLGHRRIARISGPARLSHTRERNRAFAELVARARLDEADILSTDFSGEAGARATRALLTRPVAPTAIVYDNDVMAVAGLGVAAELGFEVPTEVSILAWDDSSVCEITHPPLSAMKRDVPALGRAAARLILDVVADPSRVPVAIEGPRPALFPARAPGPPTSEPARPTTGPAPHRHRAVSGSAPPTTPRPESDPGLDREDPAMRRHSRKITRHGRVQLWIGVNFWSASGGPRMWRDYDHDTVVRELEVMREHGMTVTRSFFYWPDFMPAEDTLDRVLVERYRDFLDAHEALGMTTIPTFIVGHMSGQNWDPAWRDGRSVFGDVTFVGQQAWYVRTLTEEFADHAAVAGWLLSNEIPIYGDWKSRGIGTIDHAEVTAWARILIDAIRAGGGTQPVSVGDGAWGVEVTGADNGFRVRELAPLVDFHGPHVYRMETDVVRQNLGAGFICELLDIGGLPVVMEEFGVTSDYVGDENAAHYYRQILHNTLLAGATGWLAWNNTDYDALSEVEPYSHHPFEMHFGLVDAAGRVKDAAREVRAFSDLLAAVDAPGLSRSDADAALVIPSYLEAQYPFTQDQDRTMSFEISRQAYVAAREADLPVAVVRETDGIPDGAKLYLLPSAKQFTAPGWSRLDELVEAGATVYASAFLGEHNNQRGLWWPDVDRRFGVRRLARYGLPDRVEGDSVTLTFTAALGPIEPGAELTFPATGTINSKTVLAVEADGAEVLAVDQTGAPALLRKRQGGGSWILGTLPLEYFASQTPYVNPEPTWRLYDALAAEAGVARPLRVDDPRVVCDVLVHDDGTRYAWLVSQSDEELEVTPRSCAPLARLDGSPVTSITLPPFGVEVLRIGGAA